MLRRWPVRGICPRCCILRIGPLRSLSILCGAVIRASRSSCGCRSCARIRPSIRRRRIKDEEIPDPPVGDWADTKDEAREGLSPITSRGNVPKRRLKHAMAAYYALITHLDHQIGRFLQVLDEYGELRNTVILFTSDHGELLGDHNLFRKSLPYEGSARVPFIMNDPGNRLGLKRGGVVEDVVEMRDIMPTLLDAAGVPVPAGVDGKSVLEAARGRDREWREYLHGEHAQGRASTHWVTNGKEKFIWYSQTGAEQYFDLIHDPQELHNVKFFHNVLAIL